LKIKGKKLEMVQRVDREVMGEFKEKIGLVGIDEKERAAMHMMKDKVEKLQGYDMHHGHQDEEV
jgi:hypothetical protein